MPAGGGGPGGSGGPGGGAGPGGRRWLLHQCLGSFRRQPACESVALNFLLQTAHALLVGAVAPQPVAFIAAAHFAEGGSFSLPLLASPPPSADTATLPLTGGGMQV
jgi:hypothetical protein